MTQRDRNEKLISEEKYYAAFYREFVRLNCC